MQSACVLQEFALIESQRLFSLGLHLKNGRIGVELQHCFSVDRVRVNGVEPPDVEKAK